MEEIEMTPTHWVLTVWWDPDKPRPRSDSRRPVAAPFEALLGGRRRYYVPDTPKPVIAKEYKSKAAALRNAQEVTDAGLKCILTGCVLKGLTVEFTS